jgi:tRNA1Val (adenine37-N6)-methyltransferase
MRGVGIEPKQMRAVYSRCREDAKLILAQGVMRGSPGMSVDPPLVIYTADGKYTDEVQKMIGARYIVKPFDT